MDRPTPSDVTMLLASAREGDESAAERLLPIVYDELSDIARGVFARQQPGHTLQPTALVHEAWFKLAGNLDGAKDRTHFLVIAAKAMRQVLTDHARGRGRQKRGGDVQRVTLNAFSEPAHGGDFDLVALDDSLRRLAELDERQARVVELRLFGSLTVPEVAAALGVAKSTVDEDWAMAKAWLRRELGRAGESDAT